MWLKHYYQNAEASGPECKRMKFSVIVDVATSILQPTINPYILSRAIKAEFPNTVSRKKGKKRQTYVTVYRKIGINAANISIHNGHIFEVYHRVIKKIFFVQFTR